MSIRLNWFEQPSQGRPGPRRSSGGSTRGFTLLELMIVMAIIVILATIGVVRYERTIQRSKEAALKSDLRDLREAIQNYTQDKEAAPTSLKDLVTGEYIAKIPPDPMTGEASWNVDQCDMVLDPDQTSGGICDVHSTSDAVSPFEGTPYSSW
jgi:general secretion pathway protein G